MTSSQIKKLDKKAELLITLALNMLSSGVLEKNVVAHFTNKGANMILAKDIVRCAKIRLNNV